MADTAEGPRKLDVDYDAPLSKVVGYVENEDYVPDPLHQYGTLDTSDTAGGVHQDIREVSPAFDLARAQNLMTAARALDPDDPTPSELVVLPEGSVTVSGTTKTPEDARIELERALKRYSDTPVELGGMSAGQREAAEERDSNDDENVDERRGTRPDASTNPAGLSSDAQRRDAQRGTRSSGSRTTQK